MRKLYPSRPIAQLRVKAKWGAFWAIQTPAGGQALSAAGKICLISGGFAAFSALDGSYRRGETKKAAMSAIRPAPVLRQFPQGPAACGVGKKTTPAGQSTTAPAKRLTYVKGLRKTAIVWFKRFQAPRSVGLWP
jgi:hypothetical protein